ncbi:MAG: hypothetical protein LHV68_09570 [Elusimicrobia bacterium]|nr:hypothetical protein [Candidatus Liberimonas magnetica]
MKKILVFAVLVIVLAVPYLKAQDASLDADQRQRFLESDSVFFKLFQQHELKNDPPNIIFSSVPSILVYIDGDPVFCPIKGTSLSRVVNTQVFLLKAKTGKYYLHVLDGYMEARDLNSTWGLATKPPLDEAKTQKIADTITSLDLLEAEPDPDPDANPQKRPSLNKMQAPHIYVSTTPAELIVSDGEPDYLPIDGTKLMYLSNTDANVFKDLDGQMTYILLSGRWFRAGSEKGPWAYIKGYDLPQDFAKIPDKNRKENVKASVRGTKQAHEALIANEIPTTARIDRRTADIKLDIDGEPQLKAIEGTPLYYIFNCSIPVIKVDQNTWYAVYNSIWFKANDINGQWAVADSVPAGIYSIPVSSPLHYITYLKVYGSTPEYVYIGHTPGYYGTLVCTDGTLVFGTGYMYPPYIGKDVWYMPCPTYGFGSNLRWTPWYGWSFAFSCGFPYYWPPRPFWGPFRARGHGWEISVSSNSYHGVQGWKVMQGRDAWPGRGAAYNSIIGNVITGPQGGLKVIFTENPDIGRNKNNDIPGYLNNQGNKAGSQPDLNLKQGEKVPDVKK